MKNKRFLVPSFLQKFDDKLLRNKPNTWATRTHFVIWFAILFTLTVTAFCYLAFFDAKHYNTIESWTTFVALIAFIGFVFWLIFLLRFNVFKRYGNWFAWDGLKNFVLYFISIGAMVAVCFIPSAVETFRANQQFGNEEVVNDINEINTIACKLDYNLLPLQWKADTCKVVDSIINHRVDAPQDDTMVSHEVVEGIKYEYYHKIDTAELRSKLASTDSVIKIHDSLYVFFECDNYKFVSSYNADDYSTKKVISSAGLYRTIIKNYTKPDKAALLNRMAYFKAKYAANSRYSYSDFDVSYNDDDTYEIKIKKKYGLARINNGIDNIVRKKYSWVSDWPIFLRVFFYTTLAFALLVFTYRHSTVKTFFLSVLTVVVLVIFTGITMVFNYGNTETSLLSFITVYYIIFAGIALSIFGARVRKAIQGIALNIFLIATPFMPLVFVALNEATQRRSNYNPNYDLQQDIEKTKLYFFIAEIAGPVLLLILLEPLFRKLYRKWYASPEN